MKTKHTQAEIKRAISMIKSGQHTMANESYNAQVFKVSTACWIATNKALNSLYGMRCFWDNRIKLNEVTEAVNNG